MAWQPDRVEDSDQESIEGPRLQRAVTDLKVTVAEFSGPTMLYRSTICVFFRHTRHANQNLRINSPIDFDPQSFAGSRNSCLCAISSSVSLAS